MGDAFRWFYILNLRSAAYRSASTSCVPFFILFLFLQPPILNGYYLMQNL